MRYKILPLLLSFAWLLAACGVQTPNLPPRATQPAPTATVVPAPIPELSPTEPAATVEPAPTPELTPTEIDSNMNLSTDLSELLQAESIYLRDDWTGLSPAAPIRAYYTLKLQDDRFVGEARFSVGGYSGHPLEATEEITIPRDIVDAFLQKLSQAPLESGDYEPLITHTDDYPSIGLSVGSKGLNADFSSESQGETHAPWRVWLRRSGGVSTHICPTGVPAEAIAILDPYLKRDVLETLVNRKVEGIRFAAWLSPEERAIIESQVETFKRTTGINVQFEEIPSDYTEFLTKLGKQAATGELPDVIWVWRSEFDELQPEISFLELEGVKGDDFMTSAQKESQVDGTFYALPWSAYLCGGNRLLAVSKTSRDQSYAREFIDFLSAGDQQKENFEKLGWYPTLKAVNDAVAGCTDRDRLYRWPKEEQQRQIGDAIASDVQQLQELLKKSGYWFDNQPTAFNKDSVTGLGIPDEDNPESYQSVQAGAVAILPDYIPVYRDELNFFLESNLLEYFEESGQDNLIVGAVTVLDPNAFDNKIPEGTFAAVWQHVDGTLANDRFILVDQEDNEVYTGSFEDLNGALVEALEDPRFQQLWPSALVMTEEGSSVIAWVLDSREGHIP